MLWEYECGYIPNHIFRDTLNGMGKMGWELLYMKQSDVAHNSFCVFKRPLESKPDDDQSISPMRAIELGSL